jgi:hypothetical protein
MAIFPFEADPRKQNIEGSRDKAIECFALTSTKRLAKHHQCFVQCSAAWHLTSQSHTPAFLRIFH